MKTRTAYISVLVVFVVATTSTWSASSVAEDIPPFDLATAVGLWLLDEGEGDFVEDSSGTGNDGKLMGNTSEWVDGRYGKALRFNGHFVWARDVVGLPVDAEPRTVMCSFRWPEIMWKPEAERQDISIATGGMGIFGYGPIQGGARVTVWIDDHESVGVETMYDALLTPWEGDTDWHHLAVVFPPGGVKTSDFRIYFDGQLREAEPEVFDEAFGESDINTVLTSLNIGCQSGSNNQFFHGIVDDVAIFPSALPEEHIRSIARSGLENAKAVQPSGKLATSWGVLKAR